MRCGCGAHSRSPAQSQSQAANRSLHIAARNLRSPSHWRPTGPSHHPRSQEFPTIHKRTLIQLLTLAALGLSAGAQAQQKEATFAHQDMLVPLRVIMESGELEKATGYKINWRMFGGGGDVIKAMAGGDVQIGEAGSSPIVAAASQGQDIKLFWILDDIADAEALIVRNGSGINSVKDLKGTKVAAPFVSTAHYQLMAVMKTDGVDAKGVNVMNLRPPEIAAAWERGDIDAAFIWDPVLSKIKGNGKVIESSKTIGARGFPTFDGLIVNAKWAAQNEAFMVTLVKLLAMASTAVFLKEQGRIQEIKPDYAAFVTDAYVKKAMAN